MANHSTCWESSSVSDDTDISQLSYLHSSTNAELLTENQMYTFTQNMYFSQVENIAVTGHLFNRIIDYSLREYYKVADKSLICCVPEKGAIYFAYSNLIWLIIKSTWEQLMIKSFGLGEMYNSHWMTQ